MNIIRSVFAWFCGLIGSAGVVLTAIILFSRPDLYEANKMQVLVAFASSLIGLGIGYLRMRRVF